MRVFTKLRAEEINTISYPLPPPAEKPVTADKTLLAPKTDEKPLLVAKTGAATDKPADEPKIVITTTHRESYEFPKSELLLSPKVAERKDPAGPIVGDWYVTDYDIQTDKVVRKVYDAATFNQYFKASLSG